MTLLRCTLPKANGQPCGAAIHGFTGLMELRALGKHLRGHASEKKAHRVVVTVSALAAREAMEDGKAPPHYIVPRDVCRCGHTDLKHAKRTWRCKHDDCGCGMFNRRPDGAQ